jgi:hypothetical protein
MKKGAAAATPLDTGHRRGTAMYMFVRARRRGHSVTLDLVELVRTEAGPRQRFMA